MQFKLHQIGHTIGDFDQIFDYLKMCDISDTRPTVHLFPELFLCGYPLQDLPLQKQFYHHYNQLLININKWSLSHPINTNHLLLIGGLEYQFDSNGLPLKIKNVIFKLEFGKELEAIYTKRLLPNYDIFDELKYFTPGDETKVINFHQQNIGLTICEDMWPSSAYSIDPIIELKAYAKANNITLDHVINLSASPYHLGKQEKRHRRAIDISNFLNAPFYYVNRVGAEDEIIFDGASLVAANGKVHIQGKPFQTDLLAISDLKQTVHTEHKQNQESLENTWESLFSPRICTQKSALPQLTPIDDSECVDLLKALQLGIQQYAQKCGFKKFSVALSGGMDSALVVAIMKLILKPEQSLEAIYMPGFYSATKSYDLSYEMCKKLGVPLKSLPIKFFHSSIKNSFQDIFNAPFEGLADENIQSRLRGMLLYARSNQSNSMVLNTSNKSEIAVGYSTQYGDSVGALSVLGDLYKTEVYQLANYINKAFNNIIPQEIITRAPSAELRENQEDQQSLPPYERLDAILECILSYRLCVDEIIELGFSRSEVEKVYKLYMYSEYKRSQFCPIIKLKAKSFGFGYRTPICKKIYF